MQLVPRQQAMTAATVRSVCESSSAIGIDDGHDSVNRMRAAADIVTADADTDTFSPAAAAAAEAAEAADDADDAAADTAAADADTDAATTAAAAAASTAPAGAAIAQFASAVATTSAVAARSTATAAASSAGPSSSEAAPMRTDPMHRADAWLAAGVVLESEQLGRRQGSLTRHEGPVLACACLPSGQIVVLHPTQCAVWAPSGADQTAKGWRHSLVLEGAAGARFHALAMVHPSLCLDPSQSSLIAACGRIGDVHGVTETPVTPVAADGSASAAHGSTALLSPSSSGASIFRLDTHPTQLLGAFTSSDASAASLTDDAAPPLRRRAALHLVAQDEPRCALMLPSPELEGLDQPGGTLLALGGDDGRVRLWRLTNPPSEAWDWLPAPHDERPSLLRHGCGDVARGNGEELGLSATSVLGLCALPGELGLLVGGYAWGCALWQVGARTLVNIFECESPQRQPRLRWERKSGTPMQAAPAHTAARAQGKDALPTAAEAASLIVALRVPSAAAASTAPPSPVQPDLGDELGRIVVGCAFGWLSEDCGLDGGRQGDHTSRALARTFALSRRACDSCGPCFYGGAGGRRGGGGGGGGGGGAGSGGGAANAPDFGGDLLCLSSDGGHLAGADAQWQCHLWSVRSGARIATLQFGYLLTSEGARALSLCVACPTAAAALRPDARAGSSGFQRQRRHQLACSCVGLHLAATAAGGWGVVRAVPQHASLGCGDCGRRT